MKKVEFDFQAARIQEQELEELGNCLEQMTNHEFENTVRQVEQGWDSPGGRQFLYKTRQMQDLLLKTSAGIRMSAEALREAGRKAERMEEKAKETAEIRRYK